MAEGLVHRTKKLATWVQFRVGAGLWTGYTVLVLGGNLAGTVTSRIHLDWMIWEVIYTLEI